LPESVRYPVRSVEYGAASVSDTGVWLEGSSVRMSGASCIGGAFAGSTESVNFVAALRCCESVTSIITSEVVGIVGVPVKAPLEVRARLVGTAPDETLQVYGAFPPVAANCTLTGVPTVIGERGPVEIARASTMFMYSWRVVVWPVESVTWTVKNQPPALVGVPFRTPAALNERPGAMRPSARLQAKGAAPLLAAKANV